MTGTLKWSEDEFERTLVSARDLREVLHELHARFLKDENPTDILVSRESGDMMVITLGLDKESMLSFIEADNKPPYYASVGDTTRAGAFKHYSGNTETTHPCSMLVPLEKALEAVVLFFETGQLSSQITWQEPGAPLH